jgi:hypothetical protein
LKEKTAGLYKNFEGGVAGVLFSRQEKKGLGSQVGIEMYTYGVLRVRCWLWGFAQTYASWTL